MYSWNNHTEAISARLAPGLGICCDLVIVYIQNRVTR